MKKMLVFTMMLAIIAIAGCSNSSETDQNVFKTTKVKAAKIQVYEQSFLAEDVTVDLDGDGKKESIKLYIEPAPIENKEGEYLWDDSHVWQLIVLANGQTFPLYNDHFNGKLKFWIVNNGEKKEIILLKDGIQLSLETYEYNQNGYFERKVHYLSSETLIRSSAIH
ncbi:MAG: hypothetical protein H0Z33_06065 [Bacillaceae bacterium]|nr:hypothetical protein [Bacillaceae bacterium]